MHKLVRWSLLAIVVIAGVIGIFEMGVAYAQQVPLPPWLLSLVAIAVVAVDVPLLLIYVQRHRALERGLEGVDQRLDILAGRVEMNRRRDAGAPR